MTTLTLEAMRMLRGAQTGKREGGEFCGIMVGSLFGAAYLFGLFSASLIYMFTPVVCLFDYEGYL